MFKELISSIKELFKDNNKLASEVKEDQPQYVKVTKDNDIVIRIMKECSFADYIKDISIYEEKYGKLELPLRAFVHEGVDLPHSKLLKQNIIVYEEDEYNFCIVDSDNCFKIFMKILEDDEIHEVDLIIDKYNSTFKITKYIHDLNLSTKECRCYPCKLDDMKMFGLDRLEAFALLKELIIYIKCFELLRNIINIDMIYKYTNLLEDCCYHPIIEDNNLALSIRYLPDDFNANNMQYQSFDIVLTDTHEVIGDISFCYRNRFDYAGNVSYSIKEQYRNKKYASLALKLLVRLLKNNQYEGNKDLYVSVKLDNYASEKVAKKNGGELFYEGDVPKDDILYSLDGVERVKIYQIKM